MPIFIVVIRLRREPWYGRTWYNTIIYNNISIYVYLILNEYVICIVYSYCTTIVLLF